ncbi:MAG: OmpA family protein [Elainellaceae cyanobacterium]
MHEADTVTEPTTTSKPSSQPDAKPSRTASDWLKGVLVLIFRLLLLGVGGTVALLTGIVIATFAPGNVTETPLLERLLRQASSARQDLQTVTTVGAEGAIANDILRISLPSDVLFETAGTTLSANGQTLLNNLVADLEAIPGATVEVAAYTNDAGGPMGDRTRSFEQAKAVEAYLSEMLDPEQYHWVVLGYGQPQDASEAAPERIRRVEITARPR